MKSAFGVSIPQSLREICDPTRCALLVYDMQVGIVPQIPAGPNIVDACQRLVGSARQAGMRVFFTRHTFLPSQTAGAGQLRRSMIWQKKDDPLDTKPLLLQGQESWQIVPELTPRDEDVVIDKITMSAFESTFLNVAFRDLQLQAFIVAGIAMEVGIEPTVRHGTDLNFIPVLATDACGSRNETLKDRSVATLKEVGEIIISNVDEISSSMQTLITNG